MLKILFVTIFGLFLIGTGQAKIIYSLKDSKESKQFVYLTFDDGPSSFGTLKLLKVLEAHKIKATFFVIGENIRGQEHILQKIIEDGHELGLHSNSHPRMNKLTKNQIEEELKNNIKAIKKTLPNYEIKLFRPPYGIMNQNVLDVTREMGLDTILWDVDMRDWDKKAPESKIIRKLYATQGGNIILMHDGGGQNRDKTALVLDLWLSNGGDKHNFATISTGINATQQQEHKEKVIPTKAPIDNDDIPQYIKDHFYN